MARASGWLWRTAPAHWRSISSWKARWLPSPVSVSRNASERARS